MTDTVHVICHHCGAFNRVPQQRLVQEAQCGKCKAGLLPAKPVELNDTTLPAVLNAAQQMVLVDFWASWCGPCRAMAPNFIAAAAQRPDVHFAKVDVDASPQVSAHASIRSVPTLILFRNAEEVARISGVLSATDLSRWLDQYALV